MDKTSQFQTARPTGYEFDFLVMPIEDHSENPPGIMETSCDMEKKNKNRSIATMERHSKPCEDFPVPKKLET